MDNTRLVSIVVVALVCAGCSGDSEREGGVSAPAAGSSADPSSAASATAGSAARANQSTTAAQMSPAADGGADNGATGGRDADRPSAGGGDADERAAGGGSADKPAAGGGDARDLSDWRTLVEGAWELAGGEEGYRCARLTATEDLYIKEFQPIAPLGTHHTLLSINETPTAPDGIADCGANDNGHVTLLGSGVGESYSAGPLPDGVAYKIAKGSQLNLNLHLFNVQEEVLKGVSGVKIRTTTADKVTDFAQVTLAGSVSLSIPKGLSTSKGTCTLASDATLFAVSPHMHQLGTHLKAVAKPARGEPVVLYDGAYDFNEQRQYPADMLALKAGDKVDVECTYENTTDQTVMFGESSLDEMCFIGLYRFPLVQDGLVCVR